MTENEKEAKQKAGYDQHTTHLDFQESVKLDYRASGMKFFCNLTTSMLFFA
jgi:hypothetical protein